MDMCNDWLLYWVPLLIILNYIIIAIESDSTCNIGQACSNCAFQPCDIYKFGDGTSACYGYGDQGYGSWGKIQCEKSCNTSACWYNCPYNGALQIDNCELILLSLIIKSINTSFQTNLNTLQKQIKFSSIIQQNIYNQYQAENGTSVVFVSSKDLLNQTLSTSASVNITNCNQDIDELNSYFKTKIFNESFSNDLNTNYDESLSVSSSSSDQVITFLPVPLEFKSFDLSNPFAFTVSCIIFLLIFIIICGMCHDKFPNIYSIFSCFGCNISDNFRPFRMLLFIIKSFICLYNMNTTYSYFYLSVIYNYNLQFLIVGSTSIALLLVNILINSCLMIQLPAKPWLNYYKWLLILLILLSGSFYHSLLMVNSNMFGLKIFSMKLSNDKLHAFKVQNWSIVIISFLQTLAHIIATFWMFANKYDDAPHTMPYFILLAALFSLYNVLSQSITKFSSRYFKFNIVRIDFRIEVHHKNDKIILQKKKDLTKPIKKLFGQIFEISQNQIEILNSTETLNGIIISFNIYHEKEDQMGYKMSKGMEMDQFNEPLIDNISDQMSDIYSDQLMKEKTSIKQDIKIIYKLHNLPSNVHYQCKAVAYKSTFIQSM